MATMTTGEFLRQARIAKKLTQAEVARRMGVATAYVGLYERDKRRPKAETALKFADALEFSYQDIRRLAATMGVTRLSAVSEDGEVRSYNFSFDAPDEGRLNENTHRMLELAARYSAASEGDRAIIDFILSRPVSEAAWVKMRSEIISGEYMPECEEDDDNG